jgi:hypothetical protein
LILRASFLSFTDSYIQLTLSLRKIYFEILDQSILEYFYVPSIYHKFLKCGGKSVLKIKTNNEEFVHIIRNSLEIGD